jgi:ATP-dependent helicase/nuclease subunit A
VTANDKKPTPQQAEASDPNRTIWVSANAGSGKTHVLVNRVIRLILAGAAPQEILCLTFTKAAAAEMQNRLFSVLSNWALLSDADLGKELQLLDIANGQDARIEARQLFTRTLETPGGLKIQTIHAFAEKLLQLFPVEAGLTPGFRVLDDRKMEDMLQHARTDVLAAAGHSPDRELAQSLARVELHAAENQFDVLSATIVRRRHDSTPLGSRAAIIADVAKALGLNSHETTSTFDQRINAIDQAAYARIAVSLEAVPAMAKFDLVAALKRFSLATTTTEKLDSLKALFLNADGETPRKQLYLKDAAKRFSAETTWLDEQKTRVCEMLVQRDEHVRAEATGSLLHLSDLILRKYETRKRLQGTLDYADLIARARQLLTARDMAQWVLRKLDKDITHILVDEAQDTSPEQWDIVLAIAHEFYSGAGQARRSAVLDRTLFVVGDPKQSIFSFQGADAMRFIETRAHVGRLVTGLGQAKPDVALLTSFRSAPEVLAFVDAVFGDDAAYGAMGFTPEMEEPRIHVPWRSDVRGLVEIWPMVESEDSAEPEAWEAPVDQQSDGAHRIVLARQIARRIRDWLDKKRIIASLKRPIVPSDILILVNDRQGIFSRLIAELRSAGVPVAGADKLSLLKSLAVIDLLAIGQCVLLPEDDYSLACILKSPFVPAPMTDAMIEDIAYNRQRQSLHQRLEQSQDAACQKNSAVIAGWRESVHELGPYAFFAGIVATRRSVMLTRLGPEAGDATDAFLDLTLDYEQERGVSLAGFLAWFQSGEAMVKREMGTSADEVRLMTVHGAKGLEAPVVIIPDAADPMTADRSSIVYTESGVPIWALGGLTASAQIEDWKLARKIRAMQEHKRLLYVALTRARDELYIVGSMSKLTKKDGASRVSAESWYGFIETQLAKPHGLALQTEGDGGRWFGLRGGSAGQQCPKDNDLKPLPKWIDWTEAGLAPASARVQRRAVPEMAQDQTARYDGNRGGLDFGIAVHDFLAHVSADTVEASVNMLAVRVGLDAEIAHRLWCRIREADLAPFFGPGSLAEVEVIARLPEGEVMRRIDRFRVTEHAFYLIDYKTDALPPATLDPETPAIRQIALYAQFVSDNYPDLEPHVALLWTHSGRLDFLDRELLTRARDQGFSSVT